MAADDEKLANLWDQLFGEVGDAMADIREKVLEEPWFGRAVSQGHAKASLQLAQELGWVQEAGTNPETTHAEPDRGIDR